MDEDDNGVMNDGGLTRRRVLQRGAVIGAGVWMAPVVESVMSPVFAASAPPTPYAAARFSYQAATGTFTCTPLTIASPGCLTPASNGNGCSIGITPSLGPDNSIILDIPAPYRSIEESKICGGNCGVGIGGTDTHVIYNHCSDGSLPEAVDVEVTST